MLDHRVFTFLTVCDELSFTRAAKKLHISQPAVSQHIRYIEEYYRIQAFQFTGKRILLTEAGRLLRNSLTSLVNNELYLKEQLLAVTDLQKTLHFGATLTVGEFMLASPLSQFLTAYPTANISVAVANTEELLKKLDAGEIDFAVLEGSYPRHLYQHIPYITDRFIPICGNGYTFRQEPKTLYDLTAERLLVREPGSGSRLILENGLAKYDLGIEDFAQISVIGNMNMIKNMVLNDCGVTFLYETAVMPELRNGSVHRITLSDWNVRHEISIVWKKDHLFEKSLRALISELFFL